LHVSASLAYEKRKKKVWKEKMVLKRRFPFSKEDACQGVHVFEDGAWILLGKGNASRRNMAQAYEG